ncbi:response regulator transcription factor [Mucilaginibacter limnophilus]|uniref:Response regulator transcription factor n=1 Tax=Mucilaginibacter limnophilus TaxID=1932778 RepID=A0A437MXS1_9SPHI|nr:response regulator transcription factor [Mucilaginibacter limnophilus]RVU02447.1 response regulator transcription factor [Mucilaginibacter limnophilus]
MINILLAEDHNVVRNGIKSLLEKQTNLNVTGEAVNATETIQLLKSGTEVDILLTDINMPGSNGFELSEQVKLLYPDIKIVVLTMLDSEKHVIKAFKSGASGYLLKNVTAEEMLFAIQHVYTNARYLCIELSLRLLDRLLYLPNVPEFDNNHHVEFSERELEALELIAQGLTNEEIASKLFTSKRTVEGYRKNMLQKTGTANTAALIRYAIRNKIIN